MNKQDETLIEYPCDFPVKAMGPAEYDIAGIFEDIVRKHLPHQKSLTITKKESSGGKYLSVTIVLEAQNREQLDAVYLDLNGHEHILMTL